MMEKRQLFICVGDLTWNGMFLLIALPITLPLGVEVDDDNRKLFEDFEKKLQSLTGDCELKLIKEFDRVYLKIYVNDKGEMAPKFWEVFCKDGKEYKKAVWDEESLLGKYIEGEVVFSIANIFVGKSQSIICVAKEILVREIIEE